MARKNKKKRGEVSGAEIEERRQRQLEARRQQKAAALAAAKKRERRERAVRYLLIGALLVGLLWFVFLRGGAPTELNGHPIASLGTEGVGQHAAGPLNYESEPPVSGAHSNNVGQCGVLAEPVANELQVHSLEHGAVGIQYLPELDPAQIEELEAIARRAPADVFTAPYPGMETPIAVSSWGRLMRLDAIDVPAVQQYVAEFAGKGPEQGQSCPNTSDAAFEPASPSPAPSDGASPSPGETQDPAESPTPEPGEGSPSP